jgi:PST family polysaccharide transporter
MGQIKKDLFTGITYTAISKYSGILISVIIAGILGRLISPDDFGVVAVATVIISFFGIFSNLGISPAIVQNKELMDNDLSDIFCFTVWMGLLISLCFFFASWLISSYYEKAQLIIICRILSVQLFFSTVNIVPNSLFFKNKQFKFIAVRNLAVQICTGAIAVTAAFSGVGIYALLIMPVMSSVIVFIIGIKAYPQKIKWNSGLKALKKIFKYSAFQFLFEIINYFSRNLDKLLIGKYLGMGQLGYYEKSYQLMMMPLQNITHVITPVMHPVFSEYQNNIAYLSASYQKIIRILAFTGFPLSFFLFFTAKEITLLIFGMQWEASVPVFQILSLSVGIQIILSSSGSIFQAANRTDILFISGLLSSILNVIGILVGIFVFNTLSAIACAICITFIINFLQCYFLMYKIVFKMNMVTFWKQFVSPVILVFIIFAALFGVSRLTGEWNLLASFFVKAIVFGLIWLLYTQITKEINVSDYLKTFRENFFNG